MESKDLNQLKTDVIRIEIKYERLERKADALQSDLTDLRRNFEAFRNETRSNFQSLKEEMRAGFDNLERIVLRAVDRRQ